MRRAAMNERPTRARSRTGPVTPPFRYQSSGESTAVMARPSAASAAARYRSTSGSSGTGRE